MAATAASVSTYDGNVKMNENSTQISLKCLTQVAVIKVTDDDDQNRRRIN